MDMELGAEQSCGRESPRPRGQVQPWRRAEVTRVGTELAGWAEEPLDGHRGHGHQIFS